MSDYLRPVVAVVLPNLRSVWFGLGSYSTKTDPWYKVSDQVLRLIHVYMKCIPDEPVYEISNNVVCVTSKVSDQPAHMCSLTRTFASR